MTKQFQVILEFALLAYNIFVFPIPTFGFFQASLTETSMLFKNDTSFMDSNGLRIKKVNRTYVLSGTIEFFDDVGDDYQMVTYFLKKAGNDFKRMPYKIGPNKFCQYFDDEQYFIEDLRKKSDFPAKGVCPWPKKKYTINNYVIKLDNIPKVISSGDYMLECHMSKDGKELNGVRIGGKIDHI